MHIVEKVTYLRDFLLYNPAKNEIINFINAVAKDSNKPLTESQENIVATIGYTFVFTILVISIITSFIQKLKDWKKVGYKKVLFNYFSKKYTSSKNRLTAIFNNYFYNRYFVFIVFGFLIIGVLKGFVIFVCTIMMLLPVYIGLRYISITNKSKTELYTYLTLILPLLAIILLLIFTI